MTHSKVDLAIKMGIAVLLVALGFLIVWSMQEHIVKVGDTRTQLHHDHRARRAGLAARLRRQGAGTEFLGQLVRALRGGGAVAERVRQNMQGLREWWCWASAWTGTNSFAEFREALRRTFPPCAIRSRI